MRTKGETHVPEGFSLTATTRKKIADKYPLVDIDVSLENFIEDSEAKGRVYKDWQAGFKTFVRLAIEKQWFTVVKLQGGREHDPRWQSVLHEARKAGYPREPDATETPGLYRTALEQWKLQPRTNVVDFSRVVKRVAK